MPSRVRSIGGLIVLALFAIGVVAAAQVSPGAPPAPASGAQPAAAAAVTGASVADGQQLFQQTCAACHGPQGQGSANGTSLQSAGAGAADFMLGTGRMPLSGPGQPAYRQNPAFTPQQIAAITAYVASLGTGPAIPTVVTSQGDLQRGMSLFLASCAQCHGAAGAGDAVGGGYVAPALDKATPTQIGEAVRIGPGVMPVFNFSQQDVDSVAAYIVSLRGASSPGGATLGYGPVAEGFIAIAIALLVLVLIARRIEPGTRRRRGEA
jgi:ubiquinol-cytochrome c reductase cytochrome c subunit